MSSAEGMKAKGARMASTTRDKMAMINFIFWRVLRLGSRLRIVACPVGWRNLALRIRFCE
jgi:hypothetical protein